MTTPHPTHIAMQAEMPPDVSVVLLGEDERAGSDDDLVFWNAPAHPSGAVTITDAITLDVTKIPTGINRAVVIISTFEASTEGQLQVGDSNYAFPALAEGQATSVLTAARVSGWTIQPLVEPVTDLELLLSSLGVDVGETYTETEGAQNDDVSNDPSTPRVSQAAPATPAFRPDSTTPLDDIAPEAAKPRGRSRRIRKASGGMQLTKDLSADEATLLNVLPLDGSTLSRQALLDQLGPGWATRRFYTARDSLVERGLAASVRGRGGGLQRVAVDEPPTETAITRYTNEASLYPPMRRVLESDWAADHGFEPIKVEITAAQGSRATGGTWTRPDVVMTQVRVFPFLPGKYLEVITFEIKPRNAVDVLAVYEAVSHRRSATRSYVIFHVPSETAGVKDQLSAIDDVARQHGIGVIIAGDPADYSTWEDRVDAEHWDPDPGRLNLFIEKQLSEETRVRIGREVR